MATWIKAGFWEKLCKPCQGYKGWLNLDELIQSLAPPAPEPAYRVYTALLTQSGGSAGSYIISGDLLLVGRTYKIADNGGSGWDFTNVGAPNNDLDTYFVATGTTPNSWGIDGLLEFDNGAPVVTVLENTIGNIWWTYSLDGDYLATSGGLFTAGKTFLICTGLVPPTGDPITTLQFSRINNSSLRLVTYSNSFIPQNSLLETDYASIEIRVYN